MSNCCCWRNPTQKNCCAESGPCLVGEDDFNRANSTDLGPKWCERTGNAEIQSNRLRVIGESLILTTYRQPRPVIAGANYNHRYTMSIEGTGGITEWHFVMNVVDEDTYYWIKISQAGGSGDTKFYPTFYKRVSGVDTEVMSISTHPLGGGWDLENGRLELNVCLADVGWTIAPTGPQGQSSWTTCQAEAVSELPKDSCYGLVGVKKGTFDDFKYYIHWESQRDCQYCECLCFNGEDDVSCFPEELTLTLQPTSGPFCWEFQGINDCCDTPGPLSVTLYQQAPNLTAPNAPIFGTQYKVPTKFKWWSPLLIGDEGTDLVPGKTHFEFVCEFGGATRPYLSIWPYGTPFANIASFEDPDRLVNPEIENSKMFDPARSTCSPLNLVFPDIEFSRPAIDTCWVNGTKYDAILTAAP